MGDFQQGGVEGAGFGFEAEDPAAPDDACDAEVVVVEGGEPFLGGEGGMLERGGGVDFVGFRYGRFGGGGGGGVCDDDDELEAVELQHSF